MNVTGVEADDAVAYITNDILNQPDMKITIMSSDKDYLQLVDDRVSLWSPTKKKLYTPSVVKEEYCVSPKNFLFYKMLMGDASDNIPGVPGIGQKTATTLLQTFGSLRELYSKIAESLERHGLISKSKFLVSNEIPNSKFQRSHSEQAKRSEESKNKILRFTQDDNNETIKKIADELKLKPRIIELLIKNREQALLSQKLATIHKDVPIEFDIADAKWGEYDKMKLREFFERLGFKSLLRRFGIVEEKSNRKPTVEQAEKDKQLKLL